MRKRNTSRPPLSTHTSRLRGVQSLHYIPLVQPSFFRTTVGRRTVATAHRTRPQCSGSGPVVRRNLPRRPSESLDSARCGRLQANRALSARRRDPRSDPC